MLGYQSLPQTFLSSLARRVILTALQIGCCLLSPGLRTAPSPLLLTRLSTPSFLVLPADRKSLSVPNTPGNRVLRVTGSLAVPAPPLTDATAAHHSLRFITRLGVSGSFLLQHNRCLSSPCFTRTRCGTQEVLRMLVYSWE